MDILILKTSTSNYPTGSHLLGITLGLLTCLTGYAEENAPCMTAYQQGNYQQAIVCLSQETTQDPNRWYYLASSYQLSGNSQQAKDTYQKLLTTFPDSQAAKLAQAALSRLNNSVHSALPLTSVVYQKSTLVLADEPLLFKTYIDPHPEGRLEEITAITAAMAAWQKALQPAFPDIQLTRVDSPANARVWIHWQNEPLADTRQATYVAGWTRPAMAPHKTLPETTGAPPVMDMTLATHDAFNQPVTATQTYNVALHEWGHVLGIQGHLNTAHTVMADSQTDSLRASGVASSRHVLTTEDIAAAVSAISIIPSALADTPATSESVALQASQTTANKKTAFDWLQASITAAANGDHHSAQLDTALTAAQNAYALAPESVQVVFQLAQILEAKGRYPEALPYLDKAIRLNTQQGSKNPRYPLEKAWALAQMGQTPEALQAFEAYRFLDPAGTLAEQANRVLAKIRQGKY